MTPADLRPAPLTPDSMARTAALWSWCYRAEPGQSLYAVAKLTNAELAECLHAADRLAGWVHLQQMVRQRQVAQALLTPDALPGGES